MTVALDGPRLQARRGRATALVVFLHGYGADGNDLIEIGYQWRSLLPTAAFVSPHAPERCAASPMGRQWFALSSQSPSDRVGAEARLSGAVKASAAIDNFLDAELNRLGLDDGRLALVGFSQGAMMAMHVGLRRRMAPAAIVGYSGMLVGADRLSEARALNARGAPPPVLLIHGDQDPLIPVDAMFAAAEALAGADIPTEWHRSAGVGHGIDGGGLHHGGLFLARALGKLRR